MQVIYYPERHNPPRKGSLYLDDVLFTPGINEVSDNVQNHLSWNDYVQKGIFKPTSNKKAEQKQTPISELTIGEATPVIEQETDLSVLNEWLEADGRTGVKAIIKRQIKYLEGV